MDVPAEQVRAFVGPRADYYLSRWARIDGGGPLGVNWPAFLLGGFWLLYRRMYRYFWMLVGATVAIAVTEQLVLRLLKVQEAPPIADALITFSIAATCGTFGTYWYRLHVQRRILALARAGQSTPDQLRRAGGTSSTGPLVLFVFLSASTVAEMIARSLQP